MKRKLTIMKIIITFGIALCFFLLFSCKTPVAVEQSINASSVEIKEVETFNYDSLIHRILKNINIDIDYTIKKFSAPDSTGKQNVTEEHHFKSSSKEEVEESISQIKTEAKTEKDSLNASLNEENKTYPVVKKLSWLDKVRIKIGNIGIVILILGISFIVCCLVKKKF